MPLCDSQSGGFTFPKDRDLRKQCVSVVKRVITRNKAWVPGSNDVVCRHHFADSDYRPLKPFGE